MRTRNINHWDGRERDVSPMELQRWKRFLDELPDLRSGESGVSRLALARDRYDYDAVLDETTRRIFQKLSH